MSQKGKFKLIVSDIDGTLVDDNKHIPEINIDVLTDLVNQGYLFAISSGRSFSMAKKIYKVLPFNFYVILFNGAKICDSDTGKIIFKSFLSKKQCKDIIDLINKENGSFIFWEDENLYLNKIDENTLWYVNNIDYPYTVIKDNSYYPSSAAKFIWFTNKNDTPRKKVLLNNIEGIHSFTSHPKALEIVNKKTDKNNAVKYLSDLLKIKSSEVICVGDEENDINMVANAGLGIAPSNAIDKVKKVAKYITSTSNNEGIFKEIVEKFIYEK